MGLPDADPLMVEAGATILDSTWRNGRGGVSDLALSMIKLLDEEMLRHLARVAASVGTASSAELLIRNAQDSGKEIYPCYRYTRDGGLILDDPTTVD